MLAVARTFLMGLAFPLWVLDVCWLVWADVIVSPESRSGQAQHSGVPAWQLFRMEMVPPLSGRAGAGADEAWGLMVKHEGQDVSRSFLEVMKVFHKIAPLIIYALCVAEAVFIKSI